MAKHLPFRDIDPVETQEWLDALESVFREEGPERVAFLLGASHCPRSTVKRKLVGDVVTRFQKSCRLPPRGHCWYRSLEFTA